MNSEVILLGTEIEKVHISNTVIKTNSNGDFLTTILNWDAIPKNIMFSTCQFAPLEDYSTHNVCNFNISDYQHDSIRDWKNQIPNELRLEHSNE